MVFLHFLPVCYIFFRNSYYQLVSELENYYEDYNLHLNAENCLRKKFLNNRPKGYSKSKILSMTTDELLDLDQSLQWYNPSKDESN